MRKYLGLIAVWCAIIAISAVALETTRPEPQNANMDELGASEAIPEPEAKPEPPKVKEKIAGSFIEEAEIESPWTEADRLALAKMVMAEAEGEPIEGKCLVVNVILNRVESEIFPDDIESVLSQKKQFSSWTNGRYEKAEPSDEVWQAVQMVLDEEWDESEGALFFEATYLKDTWQSKNRAYLFTVGHHKFYQ